MTRNKRFLLNILRFAIPAVLTVLWLCFIYGNSLQTGAESGAASGRVHRIVNAIPELLELGSPISERFVRKAAHFTEFAILGLLVCSDLWAFSALSLKRKLRVSIPVIFCAVPICALFASADEFLQSFIDGRGPSVTDVLIDTSGALTATVIFAAFFILVRFKWSDRMQRKSADKRKPVNI